MLPLKDPTLLKTQSLIDNQWVDATDRTTTVSYTHLRAHET